MNRKVFAIAAGLALGAASPGTLAQALDDARDCVLGPHRVVDVSSAVPGLLEEVAVERSDSVHAGQVIARLESRVEQASLALADAWASIESEVRIEETTRALDRKRNDRISQLYASRAVALDDKDQAETEAALAALRLRQAQEKRWIRELDARKAEATLERRAVRSPIDGVVVERFRSAGEYVENQPVVRIAQLDPLQVETILPMTLFGEVRHGMVAQVRPENDAGAGHRAVVSVVDRLGDAASGTFGVRLSLANPGNRIPAGLKCSLSFLPGERAPLPEAAAAPPPEAPAETMPPAPAGASSPETVPPAAPARPSPDTVTSPPAATAPVEAAAPEAPGTAVVAVAPSAADAEAATVPATPDPVVEDPAQCLALGPFASDDAAGALAAALEGQGAPAAVGRTQRAERIGFIVVTPRQDDLASAKRLARVVERAGVRDFQVMFRGDFVHRVALGVYDGPEMAERRRAEVTGLGVDAEVLERRRTREQWWVHTRLPRGVADESALAGLPREVAVQAGACDAGGVRRAGVAADGGTAS